MTFSVHCDKRLLGTRKRCSVDCFRVVTLRVLFSVVLPPHPPYTSTQEVTTPDPHNWIPSSFLFSFT